MMNNNNNMMNNNMMNMNMFNMMNYIMMVDNKNKIKTEKVQENNNTILSIIKKMQNLKDNMKNQMNMDYSIQKLLYLLNMNIIIMDCIVDSMDIVQNNNFFMEDLIDKLSGNNEFNEANIQNNIQNKDIYHVCLNNKIKKYLQDNTKSNNKNDFISQCYEKFLLHKYKYEGCVIFFTNINIGMNNDGIIFNARLEEENGDKITLCCKREEKLNDLFMRYKTIKGCTNKNYSFNFKMRRLEPEIKIEQLFGYDYNYELIKVFEKN